MRVHQRFLQFPNKSDILNTTWHKKKSYIARIHFFDIRTRLWYRGPDYLHELNREQCSINRNRIRTQFTWNSCIFNKRNLQQFPFYTSAFNEIMIWVSLINSIITVCWKGGRNIIIIFWNDILYNTDHVFFILFLPSLVVPYHR